MPQYDDYYEDDSVDFGGMSVSQQREFLYETIGFDSAGSDYTLHDLFWTAWYENELTDDQRTAAMDDLSNYIWNEYGIDFDDIWDWADFRDWYGVS